MLDILTHDIDAPQPEEALRTATVNSSEFTGATRKVTRINPDACPFYIMMPGHYRADGTCKCNDPDHRVMRDWGYRWSPRKQRWGA